jgi:hypothetical protein
VRLPEFMKYVALAMAAFYFVIWLYGGISYARIGDTRIYYFLGWVVALAYIPFYLYRTRVEDKRDAPPEPSVQVPPGVVASE